MAFIPPTSQCEPLNLQPLQTSIFSHDDFVGGSSGFDIVLRPKAVRSQISFSYLNGLADGLQEILSTHYRLLGS